MTSARRLALALAVFVGLPSSATIAQRVAPLQVPTDEDFIQSVRAHAARAQSLDSDADIVVFLEQTDARVARFKEQLEDRVRTQYPPSERATALIRLMESEFAAFQRSIVAEFRKQRSGASPCSYEALFPPGSRLLSIELEDEVLRSRATDGVAWNTPIKVAWLDVSYDDRTPLRIRATLASPDPGRPFDCSVQPLRIAVDGSREVVDGSVRQAQRALQPSTGTTRPAVVYQRNPNYTSAAMRAKIQGEVEVEAVVLEDGSVGSVRVTRSLDTTYGLDDEAVKAMRLWRFRPAQDRDGRAVPYTLRAVLALDPIRWTG